MKLNKNTLFGVSILGILFSIIGLIASHWISDEARMITTMFFSIIFIISMIIFGVLVGMNVPHKVNNK